MMRLMAIAFLAAACSGTTPTPSATATPTPSATTTLTPTAGATFTGTYPDGWTVDDGQGPCNPTLAQPVDPFAHLPYTIDLPAGWLVLPPACVTPVSNYFVVVVPDQGSARMVVWPSYPRYQSREQAYADIEANLARPLPSGTVPWVVSPTARRVDLPVGPALEVASTAPGTGQQPAPRQSLSYYYWLDGNMLNFDFAAEPDRFAQLEPTLRATVQTMRMKPTSVRPTPLFDGSFWRHGPASRFGRALSGGHPTRGDQGL